MVLWFLFLCVGFLFCVCVFIEFVTLCNQKILKRSTMYVNYGYMVFLNYNSSLKNREKKLFSYYLNLLKKQLYEPVWQALSFCSTM